jgi:glucose/arabinose dehydrogenase
VLGSVAMKVLRFVPFLALGLTACPSDDTGADGTATATDPTSGTGAGPSPTEPSTTMTSTPSTSGDPTTNDTTTDTTGTDTDDPSESGSESTGPGLECPYTAVDGMPSVALEMVADGFDEPLLVVGDPVDRDVLYVLQKGGEIKRVEPGVATAPKENWLDLPVNTSSEAGLLGLAFHPDYENNGLIYVAHTPSGGNNAIFVTEFTVTDGVPGAPRDVIGIGHDDDNHNGGMVQFGPDDMLYISVGDGGQQDDFCGHGQNTDVWMGKILRIDPAADGTPDSGPGCAGACNCDPAVGDFDYTVPANNPFLDMAGFQPEIYSYGYRNPWRMSFDPINGSLWVADVGQDSWEEVSVIEAGDNAGWGDMEGAHCNNAACDDSPGLSGGLNADGMRMPVAEYQNSGARCSIVGLGNYRSCEVPAWDGLYFYADFCTAEVWAVAYDGNEPMNLDVVTTAPDPIYGGGYNAYGDVFIATASFATGQGPIYRVVPAK